MVEMEFFLMVDVYVVVLKGETPLDLAKQRKNVWMINHLQEARQAKGYDSPSYLKRLKMDKVRTHTHTHVLRCMKREQQAVREWKTLQENRQI